MSCISSGDIDQAQMLLKLFALLYADDTVLITDSVEDLQYGFDIFNPYCKQWKLNVNISKTKVVTFGKGRSTRGVTLFYDNMTIMKSKLLLHLNIKGFILIDLDHSALPLNTYINRQTKHLRPF